MVMHEEKPVAGAIFMYEGEIGHYHLAGSSRESLPLYPNNFMIYKAIEELKNKGVKRFHLGGGFDRSPETTLYKFKKRHFVRRRPHFIIGK